VDARVQCPGGARLIVVGRPFPPFAAADDRGVSYQIIWSGGHTASELLLRPDPSHQIRWLDFTGAVEAATRIDLGGQVPGPDVGVTPATRSPGELMVEIIAGRILSLVAYRDYPEQVPAASADMRAFIGDGPGHIVAALHAAGVLPPDSPAPGQLAGLCARLGIDGHGITAPPDCDLPERWQSMLTPPSSPRLSAAPPGSRYPQPGHRHRPASRCRSAHRDARARVAPGRPPLLDRFLSLAGGVVLPARRRGWSDEAARAWNTRSGREPDVGQARRCGGRVPRLRGLAGWMRASAGSTSLAAGSGWLALTRCQ